MARTTEIRGTLEIDHARGVIYFHTDEGYTALRICSLPKPVPTPNTNKALDITHMHGVSWGVGVTTPPNDDKALLTLRRMAEDCRRHHIDPREDSP